MSVRIFDAPSFRNQRRVVPLPQTGGVGPLGKAEWPMLGWALVFAVLAIVAGALGFFALAGMAAAAAKILFVIFIVLLVVSFIMRALRGGPVA
jgi:uncharacterized membrane protein YtjA (UPF0391 family)